MPFILVGSCGVGDVSGATAVGVLITPLKVIVTVGVGKGVSVGVCEFDESVSAGPGRVSPDPDAESVAISMVPATSLVGVSTETVLDDETLVAAKSE